MMRFYPFFITLLVAIVVLCSLPQLTFGEGNNPVFSTLSEHYLKAAELEEKASQAAQNSAIAYVGAAAVCAATCAAVLGTLGVAKLATLNQIEKACSVASIGAGIAGIAMTKDLAGGAAVAAGGAGFGVAATGNGATATGTTATGATAGEATTAGEVLSCTQVGINTALAIMNFQTSKDAKEAAKKNRKLAKMLEGQGLPTLPSGTGGSVEKSGIPNNLPAQQRDESGVNPTIGAETTDPSALSLPNIPEANTAPASEPPSQKTTVPSSGLQKGGASLAAVSGQAKIESLAKCTPSRKSGNTVQFARCMLAADSEMSRVFTSPTFYSTFRSMAGVDFGTFMARMPDDASSLLLLNTAISGGGKVQNRKLLLQRLSLVEKKTLEIMRKSKVDLNFGFPVRDPAQIATKPRAMENFRQTRIEDLNAADTVQTPVAQKQESSIRESTSEEISENPTINIFARVSARYQMAKDRLASLPYSSPYNAYVEGQDPPTTLDSNRSPAQNP